MNDQKCHVPDPLAQRADHEVAVRYLALLAARKKSGVVTVVATLTDTESPARRQW